MLLRSNWTTKMIRTKLDNLNPQDTSTLYRMVRGKTTERVWRKDVNAYWLLDRHRHAWVRQCPEKLVIGAGCGGWFSGTVGTVEAVITELESSVASMPHTVHGTLFCAWDAFGISFPKQSIIHVDPDSGPVVALRTTGLFFYLTS